MYEMLKVFIERLEQNFLHDISGEHPSVWMHPWDSPHILTD